MPLTAAAVVDAGVAMVRGQGWEALSVRAVAGRLAVTPMALYRYVADGAALHHAVLRVIATELQVGEPSGVPFDDLVRWAHRARNGLRRYPGVAAQLRATWLDVPEARLAVDDLVEVAHVAGLEGFEAVAAVNALFMYVLTNSEEAADADRHFDYGLQVLIAGIRTVSSI